MASAGSTAAPAAAAAVTIQEVRLISRIEHDGAAAVASVVAGRRAASRRPAALGQRQGRPEWLELRDVDGLGSLGTLLRLVGDLRPFSQGAIAVARYAGEVNEQVAPAVIGRDEAEALVVAEPLDGTRCHELPFCVNDPADGPEGPNKR